MTTMAERDREAGQSSFRGHPILWQDDRWVYADTGEPIPGWGGEARPCVVCGQKEWSGVGAVDQCLGILPGVTNACCGHGDPRYAYIAFENGLIVRGFWLDKENSIVKEATVINKPYDKYMENIVLHDDRRRLVELAAILGIALRTDNAELANEGWRALPFHIQEDVEREEARIEQEIRQA